MRCETQQRSYKASVNEVAVFWIRPRRNSHDLLSCVGIPWTRSKWQILSLRDGFERDDGQRVEDCWLWMPTHEISLPVTRTINIIPPEDKAWSSPYPSHPGSGRAHFAILNRAHPRSLALRDPTLLASPYCLSFSARRRSTVSLSNWLVDLSSRFSLLRSRSEISATGSAKGYWPFV
jgi:hypothetical protein